MNYERYRDVLAEPLAAIASGEIPTKPPLVKEPESEGLLVLDSSRGPEKKVVGLNTLGELDRKVAFPPETKILSPYGEGVSEDVAILEWSEMRPSTLPGRRYDTFSLVEALNKIQSKLATTGAKPYQQESIPIYQELATPTSQGLSTRPLNSSLYTLLEGIDTVYGSDFLGIYKERPDTNPRHLIESVLIAAKEITRPREDLHPLISSRYLIPRIEKNGVRFSAVIITEEARTMGDWAKPKEQSSIFKTRVELDPFRQEIALRPYDVLQVRALLAENPENCKEILKKEVGHFLRQLTWLTVWWYENRDREGDFPFPERLIVAHLRGSSPHLFYCMPLNAWFFGEWINALEARHQHLKESMPENSSPTALAEIPKSRIGEWERIVKAKLDIPEVEEFMKILIRKRQALTLEEQRMRENGGEIEEWHQWEMA